MTDTEQLGAEGQDGLGRLYRQYAPWLGRRLRGRIGADAAADVVQETYIRAAPYVLSNIRHPKAFLLRIALNLLSDERRRDARQQRFRETAPPPALDRHPLRPVGLRGCPPSPRRPVPAARPPP